MGPDDGAVYHPILHIRFIDKVVEHPLPYALVTPAGKTLVDAVPLAVFDW